MRYLSNGNCNINSGLNYYNILLKLLKLNIASVLLVVIFSFSHNMAQSQVSINLNVPSQPLWGPVGYDYANYYYLPEADVFYSISENKFFYLNSNSNKWVGTNNLPPQYNIDLYNTYKVVVNKPRPYLNHGYYVSNYAKYKHGVHKQIIIRESDEPRYFKIKGHPKFGMYKEIKDSKKNKDSKKKGHSNQKHNDKKDNKK